MDLPNADLLLNPPAIVRGLEGIMLAQAGREPARYDKSFERVMNPSNPTSPVYLDQNYARFFFPELIKGIKEPSSMLGILNEANHKHYKFPEDGNKPDFWFEYSTDSFGNASYLEALAIVKGTKTFTIYYKQTPSSPGYWKRYDNVELVIVEPATHNESTRTGLRDMSTARKLTKKPATQP